MNLTPLTQPALLLLLVALWLPIAASAQRYSASLTPEKLLEAIGVAEGDSAISARLAVSTTFDRASDDPI